jgi:hypothetical protein
MGGRYQLTGIPYARPAAFYTHIGTACTRPEFCLLQPAYSYSESTGPTISEPAQLHIKPAASIRATGSFNLPGVTCFYQDQQVYRILESNAHCRKEYVLSEYEVQNMCNANFTCHVAESRISGNTTLLNLDELTFLDLDYEMRLDLLTQLKMLALLSARLDEVVIINDRRQVTSKHHHFSGPSLKSI